MSSVDDLVPTLSESADLSDGESECDVPINDDSLESHFTTFSNPLFDSNGDFSSDDESFFFDEFSLPRPPEIPSFSQDEMDLVFDDSIPPGIDDDDDSEGDILFVEPVATMENNIEELNEHESFDSGGGGNVVLPNVEEDDTFTLTIRTFLPFVTYPEVSLLSCSTRSEDTIFDPGISTFHFSSLKPVAYENPMVIFLFICFCPKDKGIRGESS
ncbi:hypothetical protein Tco_0937210 [Tanacetum coccineum]|uniref:Uncharacterized protein n=1 Tax=Tanacetum coccineum TaxID=301880 RepID=A0ABQ5DEE1_9ASTR